MMSVMSDQQSNPLLADARLPPFDAIDAGHVIEAVTRALADARAALGQVLAVEGEPTWESLVLPLERMGERLDHIWSSVRHLHAVMDSAPLREAYEACVPLVTRFHTELSQNIELYEAYEAFVRGGDYAVRDAAGKRVVDNALRDFRLGGVGLEGKARDRYAAIATRLSDLTTHFSNNVLDATQSWTLTLADEGRLDGLPASARSLAAHNAEQAGETGYRITLDLPCYLPVLTFADDADLRAECYRAYATRASDQGPDAGRFDNGPVLEEILSLRQDKARLLGFESYAHYSLERKMARTPREVLGFLRDLAARTRPVAHAEYQALCAFAHARHGKQQVEAWDLGYFAEKLKQQRFEISQEDLRPYFPVERVIGGMFDIAERLFGVRIHPRNDVAVWHPDVTFYVITDPEGDRLGELYLDPFARAHKRGGAWMDVCRTRMRLDDSLQTPVAYLTCNFTPPVGGASSLITHDEVTTLFHEFGHGLHHLLTRVELPSVAGIAGVEWDAVELPSQLMENWCYEEEAVALISSHHETGEPLPAPLLSRLRASRNFQSGLQMLRQVEFAMFDFLLHLEYAPGCDVLALLERVRDEVAVVRPPAFNRFANTFSHIFAGGYAAGYYSYKWAEVLSCDAYSRFQEAGVLDTDAGTAFRREVLERGGTRDALESFIAFRGREPDVAALLVSSGIEPRAETSPA